jgi:thiol-disulfide isomerase/thioredoxin
VGPLTIGSVAPALPAAAVTVAGPHAVVFYKVTCPVCQMAAPKLRTLEEAYPGRVIAIGQDPPPKLADFDRRFGLGIPSITDEPPYPLSDAFGIEVVPTVFVLDADRRVQDVVQSWDRDGLNLASQKLAELTGLPYAPVADPADGLPAFRPG